MSAARAGLAPDCEWLPSKAWEVGSRPGPLLFRHKLLALRATPSAREPQIGSSAPSALTAAPMISQPSPNQRRQQKQFLHTVSGRRAPATRTSGHGRRPRNRDPPTHTSPADTTTAMLSGRYRRPFQSRGALLLSSSAQSRFCGEPAGECLPAKPGFRHDQHEGSAQDGPRARPGSKGLAPRPPGPGLRSLHLRSSEGRSHGSPRGPPRLQVVVEQPVRVGNMRCRRAQPFACAGL